MPSERDQRASPASPGEAPTLNAASDAAARRDAAEAPTADGRNFATGETLDGGGLSLAGSGQRGSLDGVDSFDEILKKVVASRQQVAILEVGSDLVGRFRITRVLGEGGMGTVYMARDATLGREVAIKVHHAAGGALRLRREAVAMAKLAHPNVVTIFEVGDLAGRPFVVMEYVDGTTLRAWLAAAPRTQAEILDLLFAAGEGLAAAHDAGLVHRDFKPENVLVSSAGRARVSDFGLARELDSKEVEPRPSSSPSDEQLRTPVTQTGAVLGTPAYMSPEQFAGAPVDARADQFAFCITAWEALYKERPFAGTSFAQLHAAIAMGERKPAPATPKLPARVRLALERGLATAPADRFASMHALLAAMRPPRRAVRRWVLGGAALVLAGATAAVAMRGDAVTCDNAGVVELSGMRTDLPGQIGVHAPTLAVRARSTQDAYVASFRSLAHTACEAGRTRQWSPEIATKSQLCFAITARTAAYTIAQADPAHPMDALRKLRRLPPAEPCSNQTYLASRPPLTGDAKQLDALIEANVLIAVGMSAGVGHDTATLRTTLAKLEQSPARTDPSIAAGILIVRGWLSFGDGKPEDTRKLFVDAYYAGRTIDDEQISARALGVLIDRGEEMGLDRATILEWLRTALADADRVRQRSPALAGNMYVTAAQASDLAADAEKALLFVARAREVVKPTSPAWIRTFEIEGAVQVWSGHVDEGIKAYESGIAQLVDMVGADDQEIAELLSNYAASLLEVQRVPQALVAAERAAGIMARLADPNDDRLDPVRVNLAAVLLEAGRADEGLPLLIAARANFVRKQGEQNLAVANIDSNIAIVYNDRGEHARARASLQNALAITEKLSGRDSVEAADVRYNLAATYQSMGDYANGLAASKRCAEVFARRSLGSDHHRMSLAMAASNANSAGDPKQALDLTAQALAFPKPAQSAVTQAWAELERALALIALHRDGEARPLLRAARTRYAGANNTARVTQIDGLLAKLP